MGIDQPLDHAALPLANCRHLHCKPIDRDAELFAIAHVVSDLRGMDNVLARETRDVRTGPAHIFPLDRGGALPARGERPGEQL
jgi:hypothetical protein